MDSLISEKFTHQFRMLVRQSALDSDLQPLLLRYMNRHINIANNTIKWKRSRRHLQLEVSSLALAAYSNADLHIRCRNFGDSECTNPGHRMSRAAFGLSACVGRHCSHVLSVTRLRPLSSVQEKVPSHEFRAV